MKSLDANFNTHIQGTVQTVCTCWLVTRADGIQMGFTDHQKDVLVNGITYKATAGFTASQIVTTSGLAVDNLELAGLLADISEADILHGKYDYADIVIGLVNYSDPTRAPIIQRKGKLGEVSLKNGSFYAELRGLTQLLAQNINEVYTPSCRAKLGDSRCKVNLAAFHDLITSTGYPVTGSVVSSGDRRSFISGANTANYPALTDNYFAFGSVEWVTGLNAGLKREILMSIAATGKIIFNLPMPFNIAAADQFKATLGCDGPHTTCFSKFNNIVNFRGEPFVPTGDQALSYPNAH